MKVCRVEGELCKYDSIRCRFVASLCSICNPGLDKFLMLHPFVNPLIPITVCNRHEVRNEEASRCPVLVNDFGSLTRRRSPVEAGGLRNTI